MAKEQRQAQENSEPKYRPGDRVLVFMTVERSAHCDSVFAISDSKESAQLKESDVHSVVLYRFRVGDRAAFHDGSREITGIIKGIDYDAEPGQAWMKIDGQWPMRNVTIESLRPVSRGGR